MKIRILAGVILLACMQCKDTGYQSQIQVARDSVNALIKKIRIPGLAVTVMVEGEIVWSEGFGHADVEQDVHVDPSITRFRIGSISKSLTAFGLGRLYEQQKILFDSSIYYYYPDYPRYAHRPSVRQVAGHLAGIRHYKGNEWLSSKHFSSVAEGLTIFKDDSLLFRPGDRFEYSSYGYNLLSAVMEKAAGRDFLKFMNEEVFGALGLRNTCQDLTDSVIYNRSRHYELRDGRWTNAPYVDNSYKWAGGGFVSTSEDIARFGDALLGNPVLSNETIQLLTSPQNLNDGSLTTYGMGFGVAKDHYGKSFFGHSGGSVGGTSDLVIYPEEKIVVAVLTNLSDANISLIAKEVARIMMKEPKS